MGSDIHGVFQAKKDEKWVDIPHKFRKNRHYILFAWLGNVRNGYGFAGVKTHSPLTPLSDQRGFPTDFELTGEYNKEHPTTLECLNEWDRKWAENYPEEPLVKWMGDHSHSWVSAKEILETTPPVVFCQGVVERKLFDKWDGISKPDNFYGDVYGPNVVVNDRDSITDVTTHVIISWPCDLAEEVGYFIDEVKRLVSEHGENVRFVFGFDS
mgnify:CR=1 FL=1